MMSAQKHKNQSLTNTDKNILALLSIVRTAWMNVGIIEKDHYFVNELWGAHFCESDGLLLEETESNDASSLNTYLRP
jgi:hypothetical protein